MTLIAAPITDEVPVPATTTRRALVRRVITRSVKSTVALLAAASLITACANPTAPADITPAQTHAVTNTDGGVTIGSSGVTIGSSGTVRPRTSSAAGVTIGSS